MMNYSRLCMTVLIPLLLAAPPLRAESESGRPDVAPVNNTEYGKECGECHFAYQPGLLPSDSWQKLMTSLDDHFGENAELDEAIAGRLTEYLVKNAADKVTSGRSRSIMRSLGSARPLRITEASYFKREHGEIPRRLIEYNNEVRSLSNCGNCHTTAHLGDYSERGIDIPGYGRWDD